SASSQPEAGARVPSAPRIEGTSAPEPRLADRGATHGQPVLLVEPEQEAVLTREDPRDERSRPDARLRASAHLPVLPADQVPELDHRLGLEVRTADHLGAEQV